MVWITVQKMDISDGPDLALLLNTINLESEYRTSESPEIRSELCLNNHDTFGWFRIYSQI